MNEAQRQAIKKRQRARVAADLEGAPDEPERPPPPPQEPFEDIVARERDRVRGLCDDVPAKPVAHVRFADRSFQVPGMQSGEELGSRKTGNGEEHVIELVSVLGAGCFLVWFISPTRRLVQHTLVERAAVKTWRLA